MFPKDGLSKEFTVEYDFSYIITKDGIYFSRKYDIFYGREIKVDVSQKMHGNIMFFVCW